MTFKSFGLILSLALATSLQVAAQGPPTVPGATPAPEKKPKVGYMRFWNMLPAETGDLQVLQDAGAGESTAILNAEVNNVYVSYNPFKPGRYALKVVRAADPKTVIKDFDLILRADVYVSFYARKVDDKVVIDMIDDTYDRTTALSGKAVIRHRIPGASVTIKSAALPLPITLAYGDERVLENLPLKPVVFNMQLVGANGIPKGWTIEVDFQTNRHSSIWLVSDTFGRFRPRTSIDGQLEDAPPALTP